MCDCTFYLTNKGNRHVCINNQDPVAIKTMQCNSFKPVIGAISWVRLQLQQADLEPADQSVDQQHIMDEDSWW